jgi:flagellar basal body-associated protein FliL
LLILITLIAVIALGTFWGLVVKPTGLPQSDGTVSEAPQNPPEPRIFTGIGRLRAPLAPPARSSGIAELGEAAAVISISFPYNNSDSAFFDELSLNAGKFRTATVEYFSMIPSDSPLLSDEASMKKDLLDRYNKMLRLGKVETLYFSEYIIID